MVGSGWIQLAFMSDPISFKIHLPKAFQKQLKMVQNLDQIVAKMVQNRGLEGGLGSFWAALGLLLGVIWLQRGSGPPPGCFLGSSWVVLEASGAPLGRLLGRLGHQLGASWGLLEASRRHLGRILMQNWSQNKEIMGFVQKML